MLLRWIVVALVLLLRMSAVSAEALPNHCVVKDIRYKVGEARLHAANNQTPELYFLHNTSQALLWLNHEKLHPDLSAGWGSSLKGGSWSALMVSQSDFHLTCAQLDGATLHRRDCQSVLEICQIPGFHAAEASGENATYWVAENLNYAALLNALSARGITLQP